MVPSSRLTTECMDGWTPLALFIQLVGQPHPPPPSSHGQGVGPAPRTAEQYRYQPVAPQRVTHHELRIARPLVARVRQLDLSTGNVITCIDLVVLVSYLPSRERV